MTLTLVGCDALGSDVPQPGTFEVSLRGYRNVDFSGAATVRRDSVLRGSPETGIGYIAQYTIMMESEEGFAGIVLPGEPVELSVTDAGLSVWVQGTDTGSYSTVQGSIRSVDLSVKVVDGELIGSFDADLQSGGNPLAGIPAREARGRGSFSATILP
ncbi:MAG TPA: hypothetical protein VGB53_07965 [Rubricoccaceae bacterium]